MIKTAKSNINLYKRIFLVVLFPIGFVILKISEANPILTEEFFTGIVYNNLSRGIAFFTNFIPFSILELSIFVLLPAFVIYNIGVIISSPTGNKLNVLNRFISTSIALGGVLYIAFVMLCGVNYNRLTLAEHLNLEIVPSTTEELANLCEDLILTTNSIRENVITDKNGIATLPFTSNKEIAKAAFKAFDETALTYPILSGTTIKPKAVFLSPLMSYTQITGVFSPFTMEANYNSHSSSFFIPATICHEMAHTRGFMREDEANFIGYLATKNSHIPEISYSGYILATVHAMNALYANNTELYKNCYNLYSQEVLADLEYNSLYWSKYEGRISEVSDKVNDSYLKANNQTDGVKSYGRMVDLLLADQRKQNS